MTEQEIICRKTIVKHIAKRNKSDIQKEINAKYGQGIIVVSYKTQKDYSVKWFIGQKAPFDGQFTDIHNIIKKYCEDKNRNFDLMTENQNLTNIAIKGGLINVANKSI